MTGFLALLAVAGFGLCGLVALIVGIVALVRINSSGGRLHGKGFAVAAIIIGMLTMLGTPMIAAIAIPTLLMQRGEALKHEDEARQRAVVEKRAAQGGRTLWRLRGGKVLVYGRTEEAEHVVRALDTGRGEASKVFSFDRGGYAHDRGWSTICPGWGFENAKVVFLVDQSWEGAKDRHNTNNRRATRDLAERLTTFVREGGSLVTMVRPHGSRFPQNIWPQGLECPLPARRISGQLANSDGLLSGGKPPFVSVGQGAMIKPTTIVTLDDVSADPSRVDKYYGQPFRIAQSFGKGRAVLIATTPRWGGLHTQKGFTTLISKLVEYPGGAGETEATAGTSPDPKER